MNMQDREFDELFRSKLGDLEAEPAKGLWDNIAAEVIVGRQNHSALPFIGIAVSILLVVAAGVFFMPSPKVPANAGMQARVQSQLEPKAIKPLTAVVPASRAGQQQTQVAVRKKPIIKRYKGINSNPVKQDVIVNVMKPDMPLPEDQPIAAIQQDAPVLSAIVPDEQQPLTGSAQMKEDPKQESVLSLNSPLSAQAKTIVVAKRKNRVIRSFGDLINVVVAKIDKRKDKLIEFSSRDEDESLITGVNLGIIKIKKEEVIATNK